MTKGSGIKKRLFRFLVGTLAVITSASIAYLVYIFRTDAPISEGKVKLNIKYKEKLALDVYLPTVKIDKPSPTILFIHGGAWISGTKGSINFNRFNEVVHKLRAQGYAVVSPQYTLAEKDRPPFPYCVEDVFEAAHWIGQNADEYNFDLDDFGVFGESAGAHLAMILAYSTQEDFDLEVDIPEIKYVVDIYGPTDLKALYKAALFDSTDHIMTKIPERLRQRLHFNERLFGFDPEADSMMAIEFMQRYSPITYTNEAVPRTLVIHGTNDQLVPIEQSEVLVEQLSHLGVSHAYRTLTGVNHGFIGATKEQKQEMQRWIYEFITKKPNLP